MLHCSLRSISLFCSRKLWQYRLTSVYNSSYCLIIITAGGAPLYGCFSSFLQGIPPPPKLPAGPFPPMAAAPRPQSGPQPSAPPAPAQSSNEPFDVFSQDMAFPGLPGAVKHQPGKAPAYESRAPDLDAGMLSSLPAAQRARLQAERDQVSQLDQQVHQVCFVHCHLLLANATLCAAHLLVVCVYLPCICPDTNAGMVRLSLHHLCGQMQRSESFIIKTLVCG